MLFKKDKTELIIKGIGIISLISLFLIPAYYYAQLPETIPIHFNIKGEANGYGNKDTIWLLPILGLGLFFLIRYSNKRPYIYNTPVKITKKNANYQHSLISKTVLVFSVLTLLFINYISYSIIRKALDNTYEMLFYSVAIYMVIILLVFAYYFYHAFKKDDTIV